MEFLAWILISLLTIIAILQVVELSRGQRGVFLVKISPKKDAVGIVQVIRVLARNKRHALRVALGSILYNDASSTMLVDVEATVYVEHDRASVIGKGHNVNGKYGWTKTVTLAVPKNSSD